MEQKVFRWEGAKQLSVPGMILATLIPSGIAFAGFHGAAPALVAAGMPSLYAWYLVAMVGLAGLVITAAVLLTVEARTLGVPLRQRFCLAPVSGRGWLAAVAVIAAATALGFAARPTLVPFMKLVGLHVPSYTPYFLNPLVSLSSATADTIAPGVLMRGNYWLLVLNAGMLVLNIGAEELYFRAWMLPKLSRLRGASWIVNGVLFALYHSFQIWLFPQILVSSLGIALVVRLTRSIWPAVAGHMIVNVLLGMAGMVCLVLGIAA